MQYFGNITEDQTIKIPFNTVDSNGASVTITDLTASDIYVYKDGTVQTTKGAGVSVSIDHNSITGSHLITIDTSDITDADFYVAGSDYQVELVGVTVDGQSINTFIGVFSIENRFDDCNIVDINTASLTKITDAIKAIVGITEGGTWTLEKALKILTAWNAGNWRKKNDSVQELLDAEDGVTVILEQTLTESPNAGSKYKTITVLI